MSTTGLAFDVTPAITGATGVARYVEATAAALERIEGAPEVRRFAFGRGTHQLPPGTAWCRAPLRLVVASWRVGGPPSVERVVGAVASVHASGVVLPRARAPIVAVVHDLSALDHPEVHDRRQVRQVRRYASELERAAAVIAVSETTAARVRAEAPQVAVHVIPNGCSELPAPDPPQGPPVPYVLAVGAPVARKRYDDLLHALAQPSLHGCSLVLVGPSGREDAALAALASSLGLADRFIRTGAVSDARLAGWYAGAAVVAAPSLDEGFGLPVVEAQRAGVPVVASDIPVHREVSGGAAQLVPVGEPDLLADALARAVERGPAVEQAVGAGRANAARYSWASCAAATLAVHRSVAAG